VICSGEALPFDLQERFFDLLPAQLQNLYGPTEAAVDVTHWTCRRGDERRLVPIGRPVANTRIYILDGNLQPTPMGIPGELHIGGVQVGRGYHRRPELTAEKFIPDPFAAHASARLYKTGDQCRWLTDGTIEYLGRLDFQVKIRGFRIELGEIEDQLRQHEAVREAVVVVREQGEKQLMACVVPAGSAVSVAELRDYLKQRLPEHMVPASWVVLPELPLSPNGKVDRRAVQLASAKAVTAASAAFAAPGSEIEHKIAAVWQEVLGSANIGLDGNFFDLGGNSLLLLRVHNRLQQALGTAIPLVDMFRWPTVRALAQHIGNGSKPPTETLTDGEARKEGRQRRRQRRAGTLPIES